MPSLSVPWFRWDVQLRTSEPPRLSTYETRPERWPYKAPHAQGYRFSSVSVTQPRIVLNANVFGIKSRWLRSHQCVAALRMPWAPEQKVGTMVQDHALRHGLIVRAIGDRIAFTPPLVIAAEQNGEMCQRFKLAFDDAQTAIKA